MSCPFLDFRISWNVDSYSLYAHHRNLEALLLLDDSLLAKFRLMPYPGATSDALIGKMASELCGRIARWSQLGLTSRHVVSLNHAIMLDILEFRLLGYPRYAIKAAWSSVTNRQPDYRFDIVDELVNHVFGGPPNDNLSVKSLSERMQRVASQLHIRLASLTSDKVPISLTRLTLPSPLADRPNQDAFTAMGYGGKGKHGNGGGGWGNNNNQQQQQQGGWGGYRNWVPRPQMPQWSTPQWAQGWFGGSQPQQQQPMMGNAPGWESGPYQGPVQLDNGAMMTFAGAGMHSSNATAALSILSRATDEANAQQKLLAAAQGRPIPNTANPFSTMPPWHNAAAQPATLGTHNPFAPSTQPAPPAAPGTTGAPPSQQPPSSTSCRRNYSAACEYS